MKKSSGSSWWTREAQKEEKTSKPKAPKKTYESKDEKDSLDDDAWTNLPVPEDDELMIEDQEAGQKPRVKEEKVNCQVVRNYHSYSRSSQNSDQEAEARSPSSVSQMPLPTAVSRSSQDIQGVSRMKRTENEEADEPLSHKRLKRSEAIDLQEGEIMKSGNAHVRDDWATVKIDDITEVGEGPINLASWVIIEEPSKWTYDKPSMRPASLLFEALEDQYQKGIGCLMHKLCFEKEDGRVSEVYFEHDLRKNPWAQRRFSTPDKAELLQVKQIHRIMFQGSKGFEGI